MTGLSPHDWLRREQISKAELLLKQRGAPLSQIAQECGFSDQAYLRLSSIYSGLDVGCSASTNNRIAFKLSTILSVFLKILQWLAQLSKPIA